MKHYIYLIIILGAVTLMSGCSSNTENSTTDNGSEIPLDDNPQEEYDFSFENATLHDDTFTTNHFSGSQNCANCHNGLTDTANAKDVSIIDAWQSSMMANAAIDPLWRAKVSSEVKRNPEYKEVIEKKCSRCHTPMATVEAGFDSATVSLFGTGFFNPDNAYYDAAMNGVSCTLCHQIEDDPTLGTKEGFSAKFIIADNSGDSRKTYGQYSGVKTGPMVKNVEFTPAYSAHMDDSKLCATCHNLDTPVIATNGTLSGSTFAEQAVYTEWEYSEFNTTKSCQDCHMPTTEGSVVISTRGNVRERSPFHQHQFLGANSYMLNIIKNNRQLLGAVAEVSQFERAIINTRSFLQASADVNITTATFANNTLDFSVLVRNHSGHKFPTSLPSRRAWLHVVVTNEQDNVVFESGALNAEGQIIGVDDKGVGYEPHHTSIDNNLSVQIYEPVMADTDGVQTYTFMNAARYLKDNRLLPRGFKSTTPASAQVYGAALQDSDFVGGSDTVAYHVSGLANERYTIRATLRYQTLSYGFAQDLYRDRDLIEVALIKELDTNTTLHYEDISTMEYTLP